LAAPQQKGRGGKTESRGKGGGRLKLAILPTGIPPFNWRRGRKLQEEKGVNGRLKGKGRHGETKKSAKSRAAEKKSKPRNFCGQK